MYFYSRNNFINDCFSIVYCYIVYFLLVLARKSKCTIFFALTSHKVFKVWSFVTVVLCTRVAWVCLLLCKECSSPVSAITERRDMGMYEVPLPMFCWVLGCGLC